MRSPRFEIVMVPLLVAVFSVPRNTAAEDPRAFIRVSRDGSQFVRDDSGRPFLVWGVNYDRDDAGRLLEDYWDTEWSTVVEDFAEIKALGANVVRIHLQLGRFLATPETPNPAALAQLTRLLRLAEQSGLCLDLTGLGCYHKQDVPAWYDSLDERQRWQAQTQFWEAVARTCADSPALFCYDLMNEPVLPGPGEKQTQWLSGELAGKFYCQRLTLDLQGRSPRAVAQAWVETLVAAIRREDPRHLVTVGIIPLAFYFPGSERLFDSPEVSEKLDFLSVHFYPKQGEAEQALTALAAYRIGKPLLVEEMFPIECSTEEMQAFVTRSQRIANGWVSFYWGKTAEQYAAAPPTAGSRLMAAWLRSFQAQGREILGSSPPAADPALAPAAR